MTRKTLHLSSNSRLYVHSPCSQYRRQLSRDLYRRLSHRLQFTFLPFMEASPPCQRHRAITAPPVRQRKLFQTRLPIVQEEPVMSGARLDFAKALEQTVQQEASQQATSIHQRRTDFGERLHAFSAQISQLTEELRNLQLPSRALRQLHQRELHLPRRDRERIINTLSLLRSKLLSSLSLHSKPVCHRVRYHQVVRSSQLNPRLTQLHKTLLRRFPPLPDNRDERISEYPPSDTMTRSRSYSPLSIRSETETHSELPRE
ncbi:hypothetical protein N7505_009058 [Penicillium chrysogenum]|uniref:Uncharacterized protein n=1 Tax=Penicillium chrysogenum TaxID=5076 RepID=A0ABQ8W9E9_PENCH|nr:hypothetical protein N7505_009058 [Penicillium chrysogenum]